MGNTRRAWHTTREMLMTTRPIGETVRELRERRGWTMGQLAAYADVSTSYISKLEAGKVAAPAVDVLQRLARALRVDASMLLGGGAPESDPVDLLRQALTKLERAERVNLCDRELSLAFEEVGGDFTAEEIDSIRPIVERALERKRRQALGLPPEEE